LKITFDCVSCILRKAFQTCELVGLDGKKEEEVAREVLKFLSNISFDQSTGLINMELNRLLTDLTGEDDPYKNAKSFYTDLALRAYPELKHTVRESEKPFETAVRMALAGNSIKYVFNGKIDNVTLFNGIESVLSHPLAYDHIARLEEAVQKASSILYLADNAGETVFDKLLIEELPTEKVTYVVKGGPVMNDATLFEADFAGLTDLVEVIENGSNAPGTILDICPQGFQDRFNGSDLIISKGQANFKALNGVDREIYHIFMVKCSVVADNLDCSRNALVVKNSSLDHNGKNAAG